MAYGTRSGGSGFSLRASVVQWARGWWSLKPHFIIGDRYLLRWYVIPRNPWLNVYLHKFLHDDEDRALHDHPWWFVSVMLKGEYREIVGDAVDQDLLFRRAPSIAFRRARHAHRVVLSKLLGGGSLPCWTLVVTGRVTRDWGFHCKDRWVHWKDFTSPADYGQTGKGCDQ
jgi:hypothetical protein